MHALDLMVDHMVPGRSATLRRPTPARSSPPRRCSRCRCAEASLKVRTGGPDDEDDDVAAGPWGGHVPLYRVAGAPVGATRTRAGRCPTTYAVVAEGAPRRSLGCGAWQRTLVLVKPDGVRRGLIGEVLRRIEAKGYTLVAARAARGDAASCSPSTTPSTRASRSTGRSSSSCCPGPSSPSSSRASACIEGFRSLAGATDPTVAAPGHHPRRPRPRLGPAVQQNLVHGSDSPESAAREIAHLVPGALIVTGSRDGPDGPPSTNGLGAGACLADLRA